jgi:DNA helicase TIP49 (TBP-interacting protein)
MENNQRPEAKPITLSVQHLEVLENFISEMPTKYGVALLNFLSQVAKEQESQEVIEQ